jgi:C1A family cysteine protease
MKKNIFNKMMIYGMTLGFISVGFVSAYQNVDFNHSLGNHISQTSDDYSTRIEHYYSFNQYSTNHYRVMDDPIPLQNMGETKNEIPIELVNTPSEFSWLNYDGKNWMTCAKNQGRCGSCWLFGAMGALEAVINIREGCADLNPDLSEQYVLSCLPEAGSCGGGNIEHCVYYYIMNTSEQGNYRNGTLTEDIFFYNSSVEYIPPCSDKPQNWEEFLVPISEYWENWTNLNNPALNDMIKSLLIQKGPLMAYFWASERFIKWGTLIKDPSKYYPDYNEQCPNYVNHGTTIVGWKDDPSIGNGGYWICKNTWGPNWGYNGFFNLEYDCLNLGGFIAWVDYDPESYDWPPVANAGGFYYGNIGGVVNFDGSKSVDPEGAISSYTWNFGDNTTANGPIVSHVYTQRGVYPVSLTVTDSSGQETTQITLIGVEENPLSLDITGGFQLKIGFTNPVENELKNFEYHIALKGLIIPNQISGIYQSIPAGVRVETTVRLLGIGFGTATIDINGLITTARFLIVGPFVKIHNAA